MFGIQGLGVVGLRDSTSGRGGLKVPGSGSGLWV